MRKCRICKQPIIGRTDKLYCNINCKNYYHIQLRKASAKVVAKWDNILHKNHRILMEVMGKNTTQKKVKRTVLDRKYFNFFTVTGYYTNKQGKMYNYVYNFAWMIFSDAEVLIVKRK